MLPSEDQYLHPLVAAVECFLLKYYFLVKLTSVFLGDAAVRLAIINGAIVRKVLIAGR